METNLLHPCQSTLHRYCGPGYRLGMRGWEDSAGNGIKLEVTKEPPDEGEESEKAGLKLSIKITKIMATSRIISWQIDGEQVEAVTDFLFLGSKITG